MLLSVVIPTCHRNDLLAKCLDTVAPGIQRLPADQYEVIVTDDGRRATAEQMIARDYPWARWVAGPKDGPAANRNNGARLARGKWIVFLDDDCLADPGWLEAMAATARADQVDVIEGRTLIPDLVDTPFLQGIQNKDGNAFWSCNLAVRREAFEKLGGFDIDFKEAADEDMEFAWRFQNRRHAHCFVPTALVQHPMRSMSWAAIWRRTKTVRWHQLLHLKTERGAPLDSPEWLAVAKAAADMLTSQLRTSSHLLTRHEPERWRTRWFWQIWRWLTLPYILPYVAVWQLRFRKMLRERQRAQ